MFDLFNRRQQIALIIFLCLFVASIVGSLTGAVLLVERFPNSDTLSSVRHIILVSGMGVGCLALSYVTSLVVWLICLKPWYRRQDLAPLFPVPAPGEAPYWWRIEARLTAWLFDVLYPASDPRGS